MGARQAAAKFRFGAAGGLGAEGLSPRVISGERPVGPNLRHAHQTLPFCISYSAMGAMKKILKKILPESALLHLQAFDHYFNGEPELRLVSKLCPAGREAIDAGANIGTYSYFLRKYAKRVYAYEPNPGLAARLARLIPEITVRNVALSDRARQVVLKVPVDANGLMQHELASIAQHFDGATRDYSIEATTIDSEDFADVGFIKVDVEQHEREVLLGGMETIRRCRPVIMTEVTPLKYDRELPAIFSFILRLNYVGWFRYSEKWFPLTSFRSDIHAREQNFGDAASFVGSNLVFLPAEHPSSDAGPLA